MRGLLASRFRVETSIETRSLSNATKPSREVTMNETKELRLLSRENECLSHATTVDEIQDIRDKAQAARAYAKKAQLLSLSVKSWAEHPPGRHSEKPAAVQAMVNEVLPGPYLEMYGRRRRDGWTVYGNQVE